MSQTDPSTATSFDNQNWLGNNQYNQSWFGAVSDLVQSQTTSRWDWAPIDESLWSADWPYQLAILETQNDGSYLEHDVYTLPINPETLVNAMPFATVLQATFGGVIENNGGVPLRPIILTGNLGVINNRQAGEALGGPLFELGGIAGGTIQSVQQVINSATALGTGQSFTDNLYDEAIPGGSSGVDAFSTGYYQWLFLQRFLESYAEAKKSEDSNRLRLALYIWKEQAAYLITPEVLQLTRTSEKPVEYCYMFRATAWSRVNPANIQSGGLLGGAAFSLVTQAGAKSTLANVLNIVQRARHVVQQFGAIPRAINADFERTVGTTVRQVGLLLKDVVGAVKTWADFPETIKNTAYRIYNENLPIYASIFSTGALNTPGYPSVFSTAPSRAPSSANKVTSVAIDTSSIDNLPVTSLKNPPPALTKAMKAEVAKVRAFTTADFRVMQKQVQDFNTFFSAKVGAPDPRTPTPPAPIRQATTTDYQLMNAFSAITDAISQMIVVEKQSAPTVPLLNYVAGLASTAGIAVRRAHSKFAVPFPYGATLETLALQYLGDATRVGEIIALNELREPFIDEVGQDQVLLANGSGSNIALADASLLQVDHLLTISSKTQLPEQRRVVAVQKLAPGYWSVSLGGDADLSKYTLNDGAKVHFYLPATVNSSKVIFIPSSRVTANSDLQLQYVPTASDLETILQVGGVDGMLTDSGDIAITQDGDWPYVQGMAALIQWARVALNTPLRSWVLYPTFGIDIQVGQSLADVSAQDILTSVKNSFRLNDAFTGVKSALVNTDGPATQVTLELGVRGVDTTLPVTFTLAQ